MSQDGDSIMEPDANKLALAMLNFGRACPYTELPRSLEMKLERVADRLTAVNGTLRSRQLIAILVDSWETEQ